MTYKKLAFDKSTKKLDLIRFDQPKAGSGQVLVEVFYSCINYKDALGVTGRGAIFKKSPIVPGIDFSGTALDGKHKGKTVVGQGMGFGENFDGGYSQLVCCDEELLIPLSDGLSAKEAMALGTAGFTAALAAHRMLINGQTKDKGPILINGATGGVGGFAVQIFKKLGYEVHAVTNRMQFEEHLKDLGADKVLDYQKIFDEKPKALESAQWGGAVDNLGGDFLEKVLPKIELWGNVASIGLAKNHKFSTTVMPFILRGVSILGASSSNCPMELRKELWKKLALEWKPVKLTGLITEEVSLEEVLDVSHKILDHKASAGRVLVNIKA
jgi:NADPH2:quinone reductase